MARPAKAPDVCPACDGSGDGDECCNTCGEILDNCDCPDGTPNTLEDCAEGGGSGEAEPEFDDRDNTLDGHGEP
mgnify:CR=1 FL=1